eukprot:COSAG04_NODE_3_length_53939_cov_50.145431_19_plen_54_part_00
MSAEDFKEQLDGAEGHGQREMDEIDKDRRQRGEEKAHHMIMRLAALSVAFAGH